MKRRERRKDLPFRHKWRLFWVGKHYRLSKDEWQGLIFFWVLALIGVSLIIGIYGFNATNVKCCLIGLVTGPAAIPFYIWWIHFQDFNLEKISGLIKIWTVMQGSGLNPRDHLPEETVKVLEPYVRELEQRLERRRAMDKRTD